MPNYYFFSEATYTNPSWIKNTNHKLPVSEEVVFTPGNALELHYISAKSGKWKASIQYRPGRGIDYFKPATQLTFRLYVQTATSPAELPAIAVATSNKKQSPFLPIQDYIKAYRINEWLTVEVPLQKLIAARITAINEISTVSFQQQSTEGKEHHLYIDQIELSTTEPHSLNAIPQNLTARAYEKHIDLFWGKITDTAIKYIKIYQSSDGQQFYPVAIETPAIQRYADYVDTVDHTYHYKISFLSYHYQESPCPKQSVQQHT
ncbi:hypothetical protein [Paraflavitalea speifideaquila]|uniref:hypothetical protein n=1 Tax=Paraflavitalea speifideaquila TaxID=3076558 RepID=UPI0028ED4DD8|nr:hypothetical protein [Paraflavitalea speifideiaquila]